MTVPFLRNWIDRNGEGNVKLANFKICIACSLALMNFQSNRGQSI